MRSSIIKRLALIAMIPATLLAMVAVASPASAATTDVAKLQGDIVYLTNKQRALHGCKPVRVDARLTTAARAHSGFMAQTKSFSHTGRGGSDFAYRIRAAHYPTPFSENIAFGYRSGLDVMKAWLASPGHRANLLNCQARAVGVGAVYSANGTTYFTQDFGI
ncbi:CAP domain-containing protein [Micromonosporaceae bacterium Da 78-11]